MTRPATLRTGLVLVLGLVVLSKSAQAQRPSTVDMTCRQAQATVAQAGGIVLGTGGPTYDRFVRDRGFCEVTEIATHALAPTRDTPQCFIGYRCKEPGRGDRFDGAF
ncbi:hypothetical protein ASF39_07905 [Methylobacterium sp. Leaf108]|nr:hypothetical protein ASF39_07905 [Methylobacterium sp. Leaf108]